LCSKDTAVNDRNIISAPAALVPATTLWTLIHSHRLPPFRAHAARAVRVIQFASGSGSHAPIVSLSSSWCGDAASPPPGDAARQDSRPRTPGGPPHQMSLRLD
jgi:hypothetical protein